MKRIKLAIFTGNRAEYGILQPIIKYLNRDQRYKVDLIVSGGHINKEYGATINQIRNDGHKNITVINTPSMDTNHMDTLVNFSSLMNDMARFIQEKKPDFVIVYADRYEGFSTVITSALLNTPIIHIEGGDKTEGGALDDSMRHAMTKLSHIHFVTNLEAHNRVLGLGEESWRVFTAGLPSLDEVSDKNYADLKYIENCYMKNRDIKELIVFTIHPMPNDLALTKKSTEIAIAAVDKYLKNYPESQLIITYPNNDPGSNIVIEILKKYAIDNERVILEKSLGRWLYHGLLALNSPEYRVVCFGNSSSGIKETAFLGCPNISIGERQEGRLRDANNIDVDYNIEEIYASLEIALKSEEYNFTNINRTSKYFFGGSGKTIAEKVFNIYQTRSKSEILNKKITI